MIPMPKLTKNYAARVKAPPGWLRAPSLVGACWDKAKTGQRVIASVDLYDDRPWLHVSVSDRHRVPNYKLLTFVKRNWIGDNQKAIMVLPETAKHVNLHPNCLHLFAYLGEEPHPLPEFSVECPVLGRQI